MAVDWNKFKDNIKSYLSKQEAKSSDDAADFFADEYHNFALTAETILSNTITGGLNKDLLSIAFKDAFKKMYESDKDLGLEPYTIIATAIVAYWLTAQFTPTPLHPPATTPTTGITLLFTGLPTPLDIAIETALKAGYKSSTTDDAVDKVASALELAFKTHLLLISGVYNGTMLVGTVVTPVPPVPWIGLK